jgi:hypothetical protein
VAAAVAGTRWEALRARTWGVNAWLFVRSDEIPPTLKPYLDFQKEWKLNDFTSAVYEGRLYGPDDFAKLEAMPARAQSYQSTSSAAWKTACSLNWGISSLRQNWDSIVCDFSSF